ncbi:MAG: carboxypeptidase regulatory-like domain-containing protein, partial [Chloroflexota bacterium]
ALNSTQIELSWSHPGGIVFFPIFLNGVHIDEVSANGRSKIIDGLQPGVVYCFQVAAHNQYQQSMLSNPQCIPTLPELTAPNVPDDFDATLIDGSIIRLNWNDVSEETFYLIYEDGDQIDTVTANTTSFQITEGVEPNGVQRCFTVRAQNDAGVSDHSIRDCLKVADDTGYYISGRVTTPDGGFLPEVEIVIDFEHFTKTNGAGLFTFRELENQTYTVSPSKCGYQIQPQTVSLDYDDVLLEFEAVPVEGIDVCIDHIDIRQTFVDDYDRQLEQSIPLIGGKLTVARVFVDISGAAEVQNLNIKLYQRTPHGTITSIAHPHEFSSRSAKPNSNRYNYLDSSNFVLWAPNTTESVTYWAEVNSDEQDTNLFNNVGGYTTVTFQKGYPLEINVAKVNYQPNETFHCPLVEDDKFGYASDRVDDAYRWAEQVLPVSHIEVVPIEFHEPFVLPLHSRIDGICKNTHTHEYNEWVKTVRRKIPANKRKSVLFTWLPGHIRREGIIAQYIVNKIAWALDNEVVYPWLMGHELAHSLTGVTHIKKDGCMGIDIESWPIQYPPDEKIQEWGLYIPSQDMYGVNIMKNPEDTYDLLSYCDDKEIETAWIAPWTYIKAYGSMPLLRTKFTKPLQPFVTIRGSVYKDGRVEIRGLLRSAWHEPGNSHELGSEYCVETQTKDHTLLDSFCFDLSFKEEIGGAPLDSAGFFIDLPDKQEVGRVVLKHLGNIIGSKEPSANIPQISLLSPNGGETWSANGEQMIRWEASDLDGDELRYELDYYDGQNWDPIAVEVYTTEYWIDTSRLAGGDQIKIKVTANDGWHEASDESDEVLTVGSKPPILKLLEPSNNHQVNPGYTIYFRGRAHDVEDGSLKDRMIWESNLDGELGQGNRIIAALSQGVHTITLSVTDGDENQVEEIITLYVGVEPLTEPPFQTHWQYLPLILE